MGGVAAGVALGAATLVVLQLVLAGTYWEASEGVYLDTAYLFLHGGALYHDVVAAQTPPLFLFGAGALAIDDALSFARLAVGLVQLGGGLLAGVLVWQLSASRAAAVAAVPLALLMPWTLRGHGALLPEALAVPLLYAGILLEGRGAGVAAGALAFVKAPLLLPALAIVLVARARRRALIAGAVTFAVLGVASLALFGAALWTDVVRAQLQSGRVGVSHLAGVLAQAGWNEIGLAVGALLAWRFRATLDGRLLRATAVVALATAATVLSLSKVGTSLTVLAPVEAALLPLALAGLVAAVRTRRVAVAALAAVAIAFPTAQAVSLLVHPTITGAHPFLRPGSQPRYGANLTSDGVHAAADAARRCPRGIAYSGPPFVAFVAGRRMPAYQPDRFLVTRAATLADFRRRVLADVPQCPSPAPRIP